MSRSTFPQINSYYLDSEFGPRNMTVTHRSAGAAGTGCRGTWMTTTTLNGAKGSTSFVEVQTLVPDVADDDLPKGEQKQHPPIIRAVKRLRTKEIWPEVDNWPMIERGLWCLALANVSDTIPIVRLLGWYQNTEHNFTGIAMEYYPHGSLHDWLRNSPPQDEIWAREVAKQVLTVLAELSHAGLAHRNIKPSNILIASVLPIQIKVGDFHFVKLTDDGNGLRTQVGSLSYVAPEMRRRTSEDDPYTTQVDMWAVGIILHEILTGAHPFREPGGRRFSNRVYDDFLEDGTQVVLDPDMASVHAVQFLGSLLERDALKRPTPAEALVSPWIVQHVG